MNKPLVYERWPPLHSDWIQLYSINSPNGIKIAVALEELGLDYDPHLVNILEGDQHTAEFKCQWRSKKGPLRRCKKGPLGGCGLVPVVHGRAPRATRRALNRLTRRRAREGPVGPRGQAWAGWSVQLAVGV